MSKESLRIAKLIKEPVNYQHRVPVALSKIADEYTAEPGEHVWRIQNIDTNVDVVFVLNADGKLVQIKRSPLQDVELTFVHWNTKKEYVLLSEILDRVDTNALARRKESLTRGMDKKELKTILDALITPTSAVYPANDTTNAGITVVSGDDIYDCFVRAVHKLEDYGDGYEALVGTTVKEKIDTFSKENATTNYYDVRLKAKIAELGVNIYKVYGTVSDSSGNAAAELAADAVLLDKKKFVMVATDSSMVKGKPISFVRRRISPEIAESMGADVDKAQRAIFVGQAPERVDVAGVGSDVLGYSVFCYESIIFCVTNPNAVCVGDLTSIL